MYQVANNNVHILNYCYAEGLIKRKLVCITQYYYLQQVGNTDNAGGRTVYIILLSNCACVLGFVHE